MEQALRYAGIDVPVAEWTVDPETNRASPEEADAARMTRRELLASGGAR